MTDSPQPDVPAIRGSGRPRGARNRVSRALKDMILRALDAAGGEEYLLRQANEHPAAFMMLLAKVLPLQLSGDPDRPVIHEIRRVIVRPEA
jgi:hypothetical protein